MGGCSFFFSFEGEEDKGLGFGFLEGGFEEGSSVICGDDSFANCLDIGNGNGIRIIMYYFSLVFFLIEIMCDFLHAVKNFDERIISFSFFWSLRFSKIDVIFQRT